MAANSQTGADKEPTNRPRQGRSPAYPFVGLGRALEKAELLRVAEGGRPKHFSPRSAIASAWDMGEKTGPTKQTIAALGHFGLFEFDGTGEDRKARLTETALHILLDKQPESIERDALIQKAALAPSIHKELWEKWQASLPSDATLETYLVRDRGFSESGAKDLIAEYKDTLAFAKMSQPVTLPEQDRETWIDPAGGGTLKPDRNPPLPPPPPGAGKVRIMEGERVVFTEETDPQNYVKLVASGSVDDSLLEALEDYVKRQRKRIKKEDAAN